MWIAIRLVLAALGFAIRRWRRRHKPVPTSSYCDIPYYLDLHRNKGRITGITLGMPLTSPAWIRLHRETALDRLFKRLRMSSEAQTGDADFDARVYVTCDHESISNVLRERADLRRAILDVFDGAYKHVHFDGATVWIYRAATSTPEPADLELLKTLRMAALPLEDGLPSRLADSFLWKALVVESVIWALAGFAIGAYIEFAIRDEDLHVSRAALVTRGLLAALIMFVVLVAAIYLWLRGSSRGHRVIVESAILLLLGLPITGIQLIGDTNRKLDSDESTSVTRTFERCEVRRHKRKRSVYYTYHVWLRDPRGVPELPVEIAVPENLCNAGNPGDPIHITLGDGLWGVAHYRRIQIGSVTWEPS